MEERNINIRKSNPLVSIIVITYNSAKYVLETLESAKSQTYQNIELIVSDDCSTDNTVEICKKWIDENKKRFVRTELITSEKNNGIAPNCNRGLYAAKGEWVKFIAGDDVLLADGIYNFVRILNECSNADIIGGKAYIINHNSEIIDTIGEDKIIKLTLLQLFKKNILVASSCFIRCDLLVKLSGFDENSYIEDWELWLRALKRNAAIIHIPIFFTRYRKTDNSVSQNAEKMFLSEIYIIKKYKYELEYKQIVFNYLYGNFFTTIIARTRNGLKYRTIFSNYYKLFDNFIIFLYFMYKIIILKLFKTLLIKLNKLIIRNNYEN